MADEIEINAATGTPQLLDSREVDYGGTLRQREVVVPDGRGADPTFWTLTGALTETASRFQFVLYNGSSSTVVLRIKRVVMIPTSSVAVTAVASGLWTMRTRRAPTTDPSGAGSLTINSFDSADSAPSNVSAFSSPGTPQAGGTTQDYLAFLPPADELLGTTTSVNATTNALTSYGGLVLYESFNLAGSKPITLRADQCLEIQQDATAGTITDYRIHCIFTAF